MLKNIAIKIIGGGTPSTSKAEYWNGEIAWTTSAHLTGREIQTGQKYITKKGLLESSTCIVPKQNILIATRVGIGKVAINKIDIAISQDLTGILIDKKIVMSEYLYWALTRKKNKLKALAQGSTIKGILRSDVAKIQIPVPSLPEQKKIAEILSTVDLAIEKVNDTIDRIEILRNGLIRKLFTRGTCHEDQIETKIGLIPRDWKIENLEKIFKLSSGKMRPKEIFLKRTPNFDIPIYGGNGILGYTDKYLISNNTIVIGRVGEYCGAIHKTEQYSWITDNALYANKIDTKKISLGFLIEYLSYLNLNKYKKISGQPLITQSIIYSIKIPLPPLNEQKKIENIIYSTSRKLELFLKKEDKLKSIKKGLMNDLLTGLKRVRLES